MENKSDISEQDSNIYKQVFTQNYASFGQIKYQMKIYELNASR